MGELTDAYGIIELLVGRKGNVAPPNTSAAFLRSYVRALWRIEMPREGSRFANLVRWGMAAEVLGPKGYQPYNAVLPVRSEEHTSELQSLMRISYAVFCLKKKHKHK